MSDEEAVTRIFNEVKSLNRAEKIAFFKKILLFREDCNNCAGGLHALCYGRCNCGCETSKRENEKYFSQLGL